MALGTKKAVVAKDIARLTRSISRLKSLGDEYGEGLTWVYASLESGVHISYPGHGGYPTDYDPWKRHWHKMAKKSKAPARHPMVDATTRQLTLTVSMPGEAGGIINDVNRHLTPDTAQTGNFMTVFYSEPTERGKENQWVRTGHDPALANEPAMDAFGELKGQGPPLGFDGAIEYDSFFRLSEP